MSDRVRSYVPTFQAVLVADALRVEVALGIMFALWQAQAQAAPVDPAKVAFYTLRAQQLLGPNIY